MALRAEVAIWVRAVALAAMVAPAVQAARVARAAMGAVQLHRALERA